VSVQAVISDSPMGQQYVRVASPAQSALALQSRTVNARGSAALPQLRPGGFSVQVVWQLEVMAALHTGAVPPLRTMVPQQTVPLPHSSVPVLPVQSRACVVPVHED
jgi:hypothetical protein